MRREARNEGEMAATKLHSQGPTEAAVPFFDITPDPAALHVKIGPWRIFVTCATGRVFVDRLDRPLGMTKRLLESAQEKNRT